MQALIIQIIGSAAISFTIAWCLVPVLIKCAHFFSILDIPDGIVKKHKSPIPYLGGVAIFIGFLVAIISAGMLNESTAIFIGVLFILLAVGLIDDFFSLSPLQKIIGQAMATLGVIWLAQLLQPYFLSFGLISYLLMLGWALTVINAFNLIDIMDGLACVTTIVALIAFSTLAYIGAQNSIVLILLSSFLGGLVAFLYYNKPPARIYLGDAGALCIGGFFAAIPLFFTWKNYTPYAFFAPVIILAIPLLEVATLIIVRTAKGIPPYKPSPDHFALILKQQGWSVQKILRYTSVMGACAGLGACIFAFGLVALHGTMCAGILFIGLWSVKFLLNKHFL